MVEAARKAYKEYPTVVNEVPESGMSYDNTLAEYARMDSKMQSAQKAIGGSSDSAQLSISYYFDRVTKGIYDDETQQLYENTIILAVLAQLAIDGCKKVFDVDVNDDIKRIRSQKCMTREKDFPKFMKYTHKIAVTKNGNDRPYDEIKKDRDRVAKRIDPDIITPMNWLQECLDKIQGASTSGAVSPIAFMIEKPKEQNNARQISKIRKIVEDYDAFVKRYLLFNDEEDGIELLANKTEEVINSIKSMSIGFSTIYRLIESSFGNEGKTRSDFVYKKATKYTTRMLNILYRSNKAYFLKCFLHII